VIVRYLGEQMFQAGDILKNKKGFYIFITGSYVHERNLFYTGYYLDRPHIPFDYPVFSLDVFADLVQR